MSINQLRNATQARNNGRLRNAVTDLNKTFARNNGRSASVSLEAAYTSESLKNTHPNSIEAIQEECRNSLKEMEAALAEYASKREAAVNSKKKIAEGAQARNNGRLRNALTELNNNRARNNGGRASIALEPEYTSESLKNTHPDSVEARMLTDIDELHPDDQNIRLSINAINHAIMEDPENSYLMNLPVDGFERRHEKNVSSLNREFALYQRELKEYEDLRNELPAREEQNRNLRERFEAAQAEFESSNESLGNLLKKVAEQEADI